jgi:hypothetical protein
MPIRPENVGRYPAEWGAISWAIRWLRALGQCECHGECSVPNDKRIGWLRLTWADLSAFHGGRCSAVNGEANPVTGSTVVLTVAHLDHTPENVHPANLRAMCQGCHLRYDRDHHAETRRHTRGVYSLFESVASN